MTVSQQWATQNRLLLEWGLGSSLVFVNIVSHLCNLQVVVGFKNLSQRLSFDPKYNGLMEMCLELKNKQKEEEFFRLCRIIEKAKIETKSWVGHLISKIPR